MLRGAATTCALPSGLPAALPTSPSSSAIFRSLDRYEKLEKEAATRSQPEIQAWSRMQRGRLLAITGKPEDAEKLLSPFVSAPTFRDADCAPFAILRLALLYHNHLKELPKSGKIFELGATRFKGTPEGYQCQYYRAMMPVLVGKPKDALPLLAAYAKEHPTHPQSAYLTGHLIPCLEKQIANLPKQTAPASASESP